MVGTARFATLIDEGSREKKDVDDRRHCRCGLKISGAPVDAGGFGKLDLGGCERLGIVELMSVVMARGWLVGDVWVKVSFDNFNVDIHRPYHTIA